jgi:hypothetical protein
MAVLTMASVMDSQLWANQLELASRLKETQNILRNTQFSNTLGGNWPVTCMTFAAIGFLEASSCLHQMGGMISFMSIKSEG